MSLSYREFESDSGSTIISVQINHCRLRRRSLYPTGTTTATSAATTAAVATASSSPSSPSLSRPLSLSLWLTQPLEVVNDDGGGAVVNACTAVPAAAVPVLNHLPISAIQSRDLQLYHKVIEIFSSASSDAGDIDIDTDGAAAAITAI
ncbi:hypothetical protein ACLKA7_005598 [Drosophila subpalustris]